MKGEISLLTPLRCININGYFYRMVVFPVPICCTTSFSARDYKSAFSPVLYILSHCQNFQYSLYYYQHAGVSHHTAEMIWDIVALPPRRHQRATELVHRFDVVMVFFFLDWFLPPSALCLHTNGSLAWSGSEAVTEEWKPFVILTDYRGDLLELAPVIHHRVAPHMNYASSLLWYHRVELMSSS